MAMTDPVQQMGLRTGLVAALMGVFLLAGCAADDSKDDGEAGAEKEHAARLEECATRTFRVRREMDLLVEAVDEGLTEDGYNQLLRGLDGEATEWLEQLGTDDEPCPEEAISNLREAHSAFVDASDAYAKYYICLSKKCESAAEGDISTEVSRARSSMRYAESEITSKAISAAGAKFQETPLEQARTTCLSADGADEPAIYMELGDQGRTLSLDKGEGWSADELAVVNCVLDELDVPDSTRTMVGDTTALMGRQTDTWDEFTMSWSYHPDNGMSAVIEMAPEVSPTN